MTTKQQRARENERDGSGGDGDEHGMYVLVCSFFCSPTYIFTVVTTQRRTGRESEKDSSGGEDSHGDRDEHEMVRFIRSKKRTMFLFH
jgi:hypothetical protein